MLFLRKLSFWQKERYLTERTLFQRKSFILQKKLLSEKFCSWRMCHCGKMTMTPRKFTFGTRLISPREVSISQKKNIALEKALHLAEIAMSLNPRKCSSWKRLISPRMAVSHKETLSKRKSFILQKKHGLLRKVFQQWFISPRVAISHGKNFVPGKVLNRS